MRFPIFSTKRLKHALPLAALALAGCATLSSPQDKPLGADLRSGEVTPDNAPILQLHDGRPALLYVNNKNQVVFHPLDAGPQVISEESPPAAALSIPRMHIDDSGIYAFWRPKLQRPVDGVGGAGDKLVHTRVSRDGGKTFERTQRLNVSGGAFLSGAAGNGRGDVYAYWVDERDGGYDLYINVTRDGGRSWQESDTRLDPGRAGAGMSLDPTMAVDGEKAWIAWQEGLKGGSTLFVRATHDRGMGWGKPVAIGTEQRSSTTGLHLVKLPAARGGRLVLYWFHQYAVLGAYSKDDGKTWTRFTPLSGLTEPYDLKVVQDPTGKVILVVADKPQQQPENLYVAVSDDGVTFPKPTRLDTDPPHRSTSRLPSIAADAAGRILVAWEDMRAFRPEIYFNYSGDGGKTWLSRDLKADTAAARQAATPRLAADGQGGFRMAWIGYDDQARRQGRLYTTVIRPAERAGVARAERPPDVDRLPERVSRFWEARKRADWGDNLELTDPFFRLGVTREAFVANQLKIVYHAFKIADTRFAGNSALVTVRYTVEIPGLFLQSGQKITVPKREEEVVEEWIWIDGDWYRVFRDAMGTTFLPR